MDSLGCDRPTALGYLELLWHLAAEMAPQGDVGRYSDKRLESALDWTGRGRRAGRLIQALVETRWLDADVEVCEVIRREKRRVPTTNTPPTESGNSEFVEVRPVDGKVRLLIHDWMDHADDSVRKKLARNGQGFLVVSEKVTEQNPDTGETASASSAGQRPASRARDAFAFPEPLPSPEPPPTPEPPAARLRARGPSGLNGRASQRFEEWFDGVWVPVRGNAYRDAAARAYLSTVSIDLETDAFECTRTYVEGPGSDPNHGFRPDNFLFEMARDNFAARFPAKSRQAAIDREWRDLENGTR
jgi:hypothetical protein